MVVGIVAVALAVLVVALAMRSSAAHAAPRRARRTPAAPPRRVHAAEPVIDLRERGPGQCPHCGRAATVERIARNRSSTSWRCGWCDHRWEVGDGEPWPDVTLCLWIPRAPAPIAREAR
jgi:ribosomal protein L37AE/L43A